MATYRHGDGMTNLIQSDAKYVATGGSPCRGPVTDATLPDGTRSFDRLNVSDVLSRVELYEVSRHGAL